MNLKLSALIFFASTLISSSNSFPQGEKSNELEAVRAMLDDLPHQPAPTLEVVPVDLSDLNPQKKRGISKTPHMNTFIVCSEPYFKGDCQDLEAEDHLCYKLKNGWDNKISSFTPKYMNICTVYDDEKCQDPVMKDIPYPGTMDVKIPIPNIGASYADNTIGSYSCM